MKAFPHFHYCSLEFSSCLPSVCKSKLESDVAVLWFYYTAAIKILGSAPNINAYPQISNVPVKNGTGSWEEARGGTWKVADAATPLILPGVLSVLCSPTRHRPATLELGRFTAAMAAGCAFVVWHFCIGSSVGEDDRGFRRAWTFLYTELHRLC